MPRIPKSVVDTRPKLTAGTASTEARLERLGVDSTQPIGPAGIGASKIINTLGAPRFAKFSAVRAPGRVAWVNFDLARTLGFDVPASNRMTPAFEAQLVDALAWRALAPGEDVGDQETITMYADRYGGTGIVRNEGAGRAGFLPWGNLSTKGVGKTPLLHEATSDFLHGHGGAPMREGFVEAIWGEVNSNLFTQGSTRILAVIDTGDFTEFPDGSRERRALIIRAGAQVRPAHLLAGEDGSVRHGTNIFIEAARGAGQLETHVDARGNEQPDVLGTMKSIVDAHAKTAAEQVRWRVLHGALSTSNMELDGAQLDLATQTSAGRTAPIHVLPHGRPFLEEHIERSSELQRTFDAVFKGMSKAEKKQFNGKKLNVERLLRDRYHAHLGVQFLGASGLKATVAERVDQVQPRLTERYRDVLLKLARLTNKDGRFIVDKRTHDDKSAVDVFNLLREFPRRFFAAPDDDHAPVVREMLRPLLTANPRHADRLTREIDTLIAEFLPLYRAVMDAASDVGGYEDRTAMQRSIEQRAAFENVPMERLYRSALNRSLVDCIDAYQTHADVDIFREGVDKTVAASLRNVDAIIGQGHARRLDEATFELGARTIDGVDYAVHASTSGRRRLQVSLPVTQDGDDFVLPSRPGAPRLNRTQLDNLTYKFTTDGWASHQQIDAKLDDDGTQLTFLIPMLRSEVGQLEGLFFCANGGFWLKDGASNFRGYAFAVPDAEELETIADRLR